MGASRAPKTPRFSFYGDVRQHKPLATMLPLNTPLSLHIDPTNYCNLRCQFCPTGHPDLLRREERPSGMMALMFFEKLVKDLQAFPHPLQRLHIYKDGEPLLNPSFAEIVSTATAANIAQSVETTTNGLLLDANFGQQLAQAGLDRIRVSINATNSIDYKLITGRAVDYHELVSRVREFAIGRNQVGTRPTIHVKLIDVNTTEAQKKTFLQDFAAIADEVHVDTLMGWSHGDAYDFTLGTAPAVGMSGNVSLNRDRIICPLPFYSMAVNSDGTVSACCVDWAHSAVVGDAKIDSLLSIWNGPAMLSFRQMHLRRQREENKACAKCHYLMGVSSASNLDPDCERLSRIYA